MDGLLELALGNSIAMGMRDHWHLCDCDECLNPPELYEGTAETNILLRGGSVLKVEPLRESEWVYLGPPERGAP